MRIVRKLGTTKWTIVAVLVLGGAVALAAERDQGAAAEASTLWAFRTPARPALPLVKDTTWPRNPIDHFVLAKLQESSVRPSSEADRRALLRRLSFDLIGLPPTPDEVSAFLQDPAPDAFERVVDRLLASPRYGERWAMYWLDLVRFAESNGFKADETRPAAWRYRDYVIHALNQDKPYDRFIREQLAGDELYPGDDAALIATGFNRHVPYESNAVNLEQRRLDALNDMTDTTAAVFLGLTVGCARCHDHKFDPITQEDYYRIQAFYAGYTLTDVPVAKTEEMERYYQEFRAWEAKTAELRQKLADLEEPERQKFLDKRKARFPKEYQDMYDLAQDKRTPFQQQIALLVAKQIEVSGDEIGKVMKGEVKQKWQELTRQMAPLNRAKPPLPPTAMVMAEVGPQAPPTYLLRRGDWNHKEQVVAPGFLSAINNRRAEVLPPNPGSRTAGRRSALSQWLTQPDHPLTARVMVNRLWHHHFGRGIVASPSDFGAQGDQPTHPELLDWLAREFADHGWSLKAMHRLMVTSATYRQSAAVNEANAAIDPENKLLWRMNRRRLEGEALRDAMLAVSGMLNAKAGGPSVYPELPPELSVKKDGWPVSESPFERNRRSVYVFVKRNLRYPLFSAFDAPDSNESCARRFATTTAPQALMLLNSRLILEEARTFAARVLHEAGPDPRHVIDRAYRLALGRLPYAEERAALQSFLDQEVPVLRQRLGSTESPPLPASAPANVDPAFAAAVVDISHALLNLNEFLYVD